MSSPGSQSPNHLTHQERLAALRTAGRWIRYSMSKPHRSQQLVTLFADTAQSVAPGEIDYQVTEMMKVVKLMKDRGGFISGDISVGANKGRLLITSAVSIIDAMYWVDVEAANFYGYPNRNR